MLDIDGTLIDDIHYSQQPLSKFPISAVDHVGDCVVLRPGVVDFLTYCFLHFPVGIWTASSSHWLETVLSCQEFVPFRDRWAFVYTGERCTIHKPTKHRVDDVFDQRNYAAILTLKDLRKVWRKQPLYTRGNCLIIEDTPENCLRNFGNAVHVPSFDCMSEDAEKDDVLPKLQRYLSRFIGSDSVRQVEKRRWYEEMSDEFQNAQL